MNPNVKGSCVQEEKHLLVEESEQGLNQDLEAGTKDGLQEACYLSAKLDQTQAETPRKDLSQGPEPHAEKPRQRKGADHAKEAVEDRGQVQEQA